MDHLRASFTVHSYDVDAFGLVAPPALAGYLQEAAGQDAVRRGAGLDLLQARGLTWVLARERMELDAPIRFGDTIELETWPAGIDRLMALRDFVVRRDGAVVARATTAWVALEVATRKVVRPETVLTPAFRLGPPEGLAAPFAPGRLPPVERPEEDRRFGVRYADIDLNGHVTNASYLAWALEALPKQAWATLRLRALEVAFLAETHHGTFVRSRLAGAGPEAFAHAVVREEDGKELARLTTAWTPRT